MQERVAQEMALLRTKYPGAEHGPELDWVLILDYALPRNRFNKDRTRLLFIIPPGYPNTGPDDFFVDGDLRLKDGNNPPGFNQGSQSSSGPAPVEGNWGWFSWHPVSFRPAANLQAGDNLLTFMRGVYQCLLGKETT